MKKKIKILFSEKQCVASEFNVDELNLFVKKNRYGKYEFTCEGCKKTIQMKNMLVSKKETLSLLTYETRCPQCCCIYSMTLIMKNLDDDLHEKKTPEHEKQQKKKQPGFF